MTLSMPRRVLDADPITSLDAWMAAGGGRGLVRAWESDPDDLIATIAASGLRGRGGAGFPTGTKWTTVRANRSPDLPTTVVVNGAEGEPGSFKDRSILLANPYRVIEGALIAAYAVGADEVVVALKPTSHEVVECVQTAIEELRDARWTDRVGIDVVVGPQQYLYGEETALLEVIEGREPFPRIAPPWRRGAEDLGDDSALAGQADLAGSSPDEPPALVDNVETLANIPGIVVNGPEWFREVGTEASPGTLVVTMSGGVVRAAVAEVPLGTSLRDAIELIGGGPRTGSVIGVLPGVSNRLITAADLDVPLTYEDVARIGSGLGAGAYLVLDEASDPIAVAAGVSRFLAVESCGQCRPCKQDGLAISALLARVCDATAEADTTDELESRLRSITDGARCYLATQHQEVVASIIEAFPNEFERQAGGDAPAVTPVQIAEIDHLSRGEAILETAQSTKQPDWTHDEIDSGAAPADRINQRQAAGHRTR